MKHKRAVQIVFTAFAAFILLNLILWKFVTEELLVGKKSVGGDLSRIGYILGSKMYRKTYIDLPLRHLESKDYSGQKLDVLTVGDSFSWGGGGGRNCYYQDYIASYNKFTVLNIYPYRGTDSITTISAMYNDGIIDRLKPRFILIECSQKFCISDLAREIDFGLEMPVDKSVPYGGQGPVSKPPFVGFINNGNFKFLLFNLFYHFNDHAFFGNVHVRELNKEMFSVRDGNKLLFFREDVKRIPRANPENIALMNRNLNTLAEKLKTRGIKLLFMPCVDKYTLYCGYLKKNPYPQSIFFEELRKLPKSYELIDTKAILAEELKKGEKDIFYADDTHWSWKASESIFKNIRFAN